MSKCTPDATDTMGYLEGLEWIENMAKRYRQEQCAACNHWHIWKKK